MNWKRQLDTNIADKDEDWGLLLKSFQTVKGETSACVPAELTGRYVRHTAGMHFVSDSYRHIYVLSRVMVLL